MHRKAIVTRVAIWFVLSSVVAVAAEGQMPDKPGPKHKCPVCGMFVAKYPDWIAQIRFDDGALVFFDGAKDLFKYYFNLQKYDPHRTVAQISAVYVTEYYEMKPIEARSAFFVIGSDVYGPMGRELIAFKSAADAGQFMDDHQGKRVLTFDRISASTLSKLD